MARDLHTDTAEAVQGETLAPIGMVELEFESGWVRFWSGYGVLTWNGVPWYGAGHFGKISQIEETAEIRAVGIQLSLSGLPLDLAADDGRKLPEIVLAESWQGRRAYVYFAVLEGRSFVGEPIRIFGGFMDQISLRSGEIMLSCESALFDLERTKIRRWTPNDQRSEYPDDAGCDYVPAMQEIDIKWGRGA